MMYERITTANRRFVFEYFHHRTIGPRQVLIRATKHQNDQISNDTLWSGVAVRLGGTRTTNRYVGLDPEAVRVWLLLPQYAEFPSFDSELYVHDEEG